MAIRSSLILIISFYEVTSFMHPYAPKPYYTRGPRPREVYNVDPSRLQQGYSGYPYAVQEPPISYPVYQNPVEQPNYQIYQQVLEPNPIYQQPLEPVATYQIYQQPVEPNPVSYPVYQPVEAVADIQAPVAPIVAPPAVPQAVPELPTIKNDKPAGFDSNVLNNLAIALQLLILNNLVASPVSNNLDAIKNAVEGAKILNKPCEAEYEYPLLNAKFLGSSNFDDASSIIAYGYGSPATSPRVGALLKSPYDYLSASTSEYPTKNSLQSPYAAIFSPDNIKELFTMSDYY